MQKLLVLSHLFLTALSFGLGDGSKKYCFISKTVLPIFSSRSFMVSSLRFGSLLHFSVYFCTYCEEMF